jgi:hypothetical protein
MLTAEQAMRLLDNRMMFDWFQLTRDGQNRLRVHARLAKVGKYRDCWGRKGESFAQLVERFICDKVFDSDGCGENYIAGVLN